MFLFTYFSPRAASQVQLLIPVSLPLFPIFGGQRVRFSQCGVLLDQTPQAVCVACLPFQRAQTGLSQDPEKGLTRVCHVPQQETRGWVDTGHLQL